jgi:hypothetical protein
VVVAVVDGPGRDDNPQPDRGAYDQGASWGAHS